jgi:lipopolysaccharide biosynthesis glycosyltransferase
MNGIGAATSDATGAQGIGTRMTLVFNCDDTFAMPLATTLRSAVEATRDHWPIDVRVLTNRFSARHRRRVLDSLPAGAADLRWIDVDLGWFNAATTETGLPSITCARILIPQVLDASISRVLYIDADILVLGDLRRLWFTDLEGAPLGAVVDDIDRHLKVGSASVSRVPQVQRYFNAGILLIDVERWRTEGISDKAMTYLAANPHSPFADQDALNVACDGRWKSLDPRWNFQYHRTIALQDFASAERPFVVHFVTRSKPWHPASLSSYAGLYDAFRERTAYAKTPADRLRDAAMVGTCRFKRHLKRYRVVQSVLARSAGV